MVHIPISRVLNTYVGGRIIYYLASLSVSVPSPANPSLKYEINHSQ